MKNKVLKVHPSDDAIVALTDLKKGERIEFEGQVYLLKNDVPVKHKFAGKTYQVGDPVIMYGILVGKATQVIEKGDCLTINNVKHAAAEFTGKTEQVSWQTPDISRFQGRTFQGYHRPDGKVGTANYWLMVPMVFCENRNLNFIKEALLKELGYAKGAKYQQHSRKLVEMYQSGKSTDEILAEELLVEEESDMAQRIFPNVDGIKFLNHEGGCGGTREDSDTLCSLLAGYITHPNVAGVTVLSLGCQHAQVDILKKEIEKRDPDFSKPIYIFEQQEIGSEEKLVTEAIKKTFVGLIQANEIIRQPAPLNKLTIGLECGGSDGFSGISANPALGYVSDLLSTLGGTVILSEFPELCGVEQELINRCTSEALANKFRSIQGAYAAKAEAVGSGFDMNPSPGNIKDGLITDAIKSAGAAKKGGTSPVTDVLDYTEPATQPGLSLLCTPGNDVESTTGLAGSWANLILFTTGLGTPTGNPVTPVIKVASNTRLAERMPDIIDVSTGSIITGEETIQEMGERLLEYCIKVASGEISTKAMQLGQDDFIPWKRGVSL
ncbi:altronate dehydratase family protein [Rapidithrix thailandica]|uniref:Altronate dehydratase family protein n=1 Tax=Rapidithrix thailandica TaxID=413964 RepID=A0AAW9RUF6_9BACT